jgi:alkylhydroperoxidase family enzyme
MPLDQLHWNARDLLQQGEDLQRINSLVAWRETTFFSERERAALAWAEAVMDIMRNDISDPLFDALKSNFSDQEIAEIGFAVALMNGWNRIAIGFRQPVRKAAFIVRETRES